MLDPESVSHSQSPANSRLDDIDVAWTVLAQHVGSFCETWEEAQTPPLLSDYAPAQPGPLRRMALVELVKIDLEQRWQRQLEPLRIEDYVALYTELAEPDGSVPNDLVYEEYHVRRQYGEDVSADEFFQRFPAQANALRRLFGVDAFASTSLFDSGSPELPELGDSIDDFDLLTKLGKGAFGSVYLARQRSMQRIVALKITATQSREAQTLAQLDHPHIVRVFDERELPQQRLRLLYMQYIPGTSLDELIKSIQGQPKKEWTGAAVVETLREQLEPRGEPVLCDRSLPDASWLDVACRLGIQLASALHYAHRQGVLHRDLKPANILLDARGDARVVDFNVSYCSKLDGATPLAYFGGSLAYMSPEQMRACDPNDSQQPDSLDERSDIYSLGVVLWELFSASRPFQDEVVGASWPQTLQAASERRQRSPKVDGLAREPFRDAISVAPVLLRCLQPDRRDRYDSAADVARELGLCLQPKTRRLLDPPRTLQSMFIERWPLVVLLLLVVLPNVVAAVFNIAYNHAEIIRHVPQADDAFQRAMLVINGTAFPIGLLICTVVAWPVARVMSDSRSSKAGRRLRNRCLSLGHWGAILGLCEWLAAGLAFPLAIHLAGIALSSAHYFHFMASMALCGAITSSYPFFLLTGVAVWRLYPRMLRDVISAGAPPPPDEVSQLRRVYRRTWLYLAVAAVLPLGGVAMLVLFGNAQNRWALGFLSLGGMAGFSWVFVQARSLQKSLVLLADYIESLNMPLETLAESRGARL